MKKTKILFMSLLFFTFFHLEKMYADVIYEMENSDKKKTEVKTEDKADRKIDFSRDDIFKKIRRSNRQIS